MLKTHDFDECLERSNSQREEAFWEECYRAAFPDFKCMIDNRRDNGAQRCGVDRLVVLNSTQVLRIDEKSRSRDYGDMLLEVVSNDRTMAPGWIEKDMTIDFLAYGIAPASRAYLFPWPLLRASWVRHAEQWKALAKREEHGFRTIKAQNRGYATWSIAVPMETLLGAVSDCLVVDVQGVAA